MTELSKETCSACEIGAPLVPHGQQLELLNELDGWIIDSSDIAKKAYKEKRSIIDVAHEETGLPLKKLKALLNPAKLTKGGV